MPEPTLQLSILLLVGGLVVLFLELFIPSAGALFVVAMVCIVSSVAVAFFVSPWAGLSMIAIDLVLAYFLPGIGLKLWQKTPMGRRMFLDAPEPHEGEISPVVTASVDGFDYHELLGESGTAITPLRPAGITDFSGRRVDTVSEGVIIDRGERVRVVAVEGRRVVVRRIDDH